MNVTRANQTIATVGSMAIAALLGLGIAGCGGESQYYKNGYQDGKTTAFQQGFSQFALGSNANEINHAGYEAYCNEMTDGASIDGLGLGPTDATEAQWVNGCAAGLAADQQ